jgi:hypothetical protein
MEFHRHGVPSTQNSVDTKFRRHGLPLIQNSIDTEFPRRHGIPRGHGILPSTRNSPVDTEFCRHGFLSTRNSVDTELRRHGIPSTRNSVNTEFCIFLFTSVYLVSYAMLFIFVPTLTEFRIQKYTEFRGISRNSADIKSQSLQYV